MTLLAMEELGLILTGVLSQPTLQARIGQIGQPPASSLCSFCCGLRTIWGRENTWFLHTHAAAALSDVRTEPGKVDKGEVLKAVPGAGQ